MPGRPKPRRIICRPYRLYSSSVSKVCSCMVRPVVTSSDTSPVVERIPAPAVMWMKEDDGLMNCTTWNLQHLNFRKGSTASAEGKGVSCEPARSILRAGNHLFSRFALSFVTFVDSVHCALPACRGRLPQPFSPSLSLWLINTNSQLATCNPVQNINRTIQRLRNHYQLHSLN